MFSAVTLIAFSFAGMANTGGEEKLEFIEALENNSNKDIELLESNFDCFGSAVAFLELLVADGGCEYTSAEAADIINLAYALCRRYS